MEQTMPTNLAIDDILLNQALRLGGHRTKRETVNEALREYIRWRKRLAAIRAFGTFDFDPGTDYKRGRKR
jgi:Arc/MetJ family transcription regulator